MASDNYFCWRNEMESALLPLTEPAQVMAVVEQQTAKLGFDFYAFYIRHPVPFTRPKVFIKTNYPSKWLKTYEKEQYEKIDPVITYCQTPGKQLLWNDEIAREGSRVFDAAKEFGICSGFSCSGMAKNRAIGILSMASGKPFENIELKQETQLKMQHLVVLLLEALQRVRDISMTVVDMELSPREREILQWTAEGKTSAETALILSISENTVNFHQKNMQKRFNAPNRTQLAAYAAAIGLL
uniref:transcriptional regulator SdiA n=1 Tax=Pantoea sp. IMH TaxID=1267600 RepID=UPI00046AF919|nr:transcriptional regulator SdiA [Pantoea sp. IMH]